MLVQTPEPRGRSLARRLEDLLDTAPRALTAGTALAVSAVLYLIIGFWPTRQPLVVPLTALDRAIPFLDWTGAVYLSMYVFFAFGLLIFPAKAYGRALVTVSVFTLVHFAIYLACPTAYPRPTPGNSIGIVSFIQAIDRPTNACPSLHAYASTFIALALWRTDGRRWVRLTAAVWCAAICVSTLTTKQHALIDIACGMMLALAAYWMFVRLLRRDDADSNRDLA